MTTSTAKLFWSNWSGTVQCSPSQILFPKTIQEVVKIINQARTEGKTIRVVGSGHSFTPLVQTDEILVSLDEMQGVEFVNEENQTATVWAGTKLKRLGEELFLLGWAQENLGDIDIQSIAGAISTGTHGTGVEFGNISSQVVAITLVTADGNVITCSEIEEPELFKAAQVSLGALGIIVKVTLRVQPSYRLHYQSSRMSLTECLDRLDEYKTKYRHFEFYWFPYTNDVQVKWLNPTTKPCSKNRRWSYLEKMILENGAFWILSELVRRFPRLSRVASKFSAKAVPVSEEIDESYRLFATPRMVRFTEMEYSVPSEQMRPILLEIQKCIEEQKFHVHFPIECRYVKGDDIWISSAYGRDSAYIAVHMYKGMPYQEYFHALETILQRYDGRPHWGKMHTMSKEQLKEKYPKWEDFLRIRAQLDPQGIFLNSYLQKIFGSE